LKSERPILDVLFPQVRAEILRLLFAAPTKQRYVRELMSLSGLALCTVQDELRKLSTVGLVTSWSNGYHRFYAANRKHPLFPELLRIVQLSARLPRAKHAALYRQRRLRTQTKRRRQNVPALPADRPTKWHLFSRADKSPTP
jgi:predicted transcriptional regulator